ncbi:hypothetical protein BJV78DRAFT_93994 [Lactifluus subvellereus]|nr:hypothetical protein BJV78DRAFT_93994 [Lactifluus subvellereus]
MPSGMMTDSLSLLKPLLTVLGLNNLTTLTTYNGVLKEFGWTRCETIKVQRLWSLDLMDSFYVCRTFERVCSLARRWTLDLIFLVLLHYRRRLGPTGDRVLNFAIIVTMGEAEHAGVAGYDQFNQRAVSTCYRPLVASDLTFTCALALDWR